MRNAAVVKAFAEDAEPLSPGDFIGNWMKLMSPAAEKLGPRGTLSRDEYLMRLEQANVVNSIDNLMTFPRLRTQIERGQVLVHGAYFGVATGQLSVRNPDTEEVSCRLQQTICADVRATALLTLGCSPMLRGAWPE
jgi:carbonic anhydrase